MTTLNNKGFTYIETIIAVVIVTLFLAATLPLVVENIAANKRAEKKLAAIEAANLKIEEIRSENFDLIDDETFSPQGLTDGQGQIIVTSDIDGDGTDEEDIKKITVEVTFPYKSHNEKATLVTFITRKGV